MPTYTNQESRLLTLSTPLGEDMLLLTGFTGEEALSRLFSYRLEMVSEEEDLKPQDIVGKSVTWGVQEVDKETRWFNGHVSGFAAGSTRLHGRRVYRMEVVPYLWFLTRTANCRIFQNKKTPDILEEVFGDYGLTDFEPMLKRSYPEWEYCVQYRETAFNFAARLMEHEGIFWYFKHENGKHTLVLADHKGAYKEVPESPVAYHAGTLAPNHIDSWEHRYEFRSGKFAHTDYNFKDPGANLLAGTNTVIDLPGVEKFEVFDYPGAYAVKANGEADVKVRMEEVEAAYDVVTASGGCPTFSPGWKFTLGAHEVEAETGRSYVVTSIRHSAKDTSLGQNGQPSEYRNTFTCIPAAVVFRAPRLTPRPVVQGPQTAVVVGPAGEEIYTDPYGRVKVQFFWDRKGKKDENSSCWIRVAQNWAGKGWGLIANPRIGQEVVVDFLEGDPDRPLITGRVYNAEQMPPYALPASQTQTGIKTRSSNGSGPDSFNELRFEDRKGSEQLFLHAQRNQDIEVNKDETHWVGQDRKKTVDRNETTLVKGNRTETVKRNEKITIRRNRTEVVIKDESVTVGGKRTERVRKDESITILGKRSKKVKKDEQTSIDGKRTESVKKDEVIIIVGNRTKAVKKSENLSVKESRGASVGQNDTLSVGKLLKITAGEAIMLKTGKASIVMNKNGTITITGQNITIDAKGEKVVRAGKNITLKGKKILEN